MAPVFWTVLLVPQFFNTQFQFALSIPSISPCSPALTYAGHINLISPHPTQHRIPFIEFHFSHACRSRGKYKLSAIPINPHTPADFNAISIFNGDRNRHAKIRRHVFLLNRYPDDVAGDGCLRLLRPAISGNRHAVDPLFEKPVQRRAEMFFGHLLQIQRSRVSAPIGLHKTGKKRPEFCVAAGIEIAQQPAQRMHHECAFAISCQIIIQLVFLAAAYQPAPPAKKP